MGVAKFSRLRDCVRCAVLAFERRFVSPDELADLAGRLERKALADLARLPGPTLLSYSLTLLDLCRELAWSPPNRRPPIQRDLETLLGIPTERILGRPPES